MKKDFFNIEDLAQGKCAVKNDGTLEELREVLRKAFPEDKGLTSGSASYYFKASEKAWFFDESTDLPTQSVKCFLHDSKSGNELEKINTELFKNLNTSIKIEDIENNIVSPQEKRHSHYNNENGSLYKIAEQLGLNAYEFDILKRIARCRKKGQFKQDLQKIKDTVDLYLKEVEHD